MRYHEAHEEVNHEDNNMYITAAKKKQPVIYIPEKIDLSRCGATCQEYPEDALYFLSLLFRQTTFRKKGGDGYAEINKQLLRRQINRHAEKPIVDEFRAAGVIEWRDGGAYKKNHYSRSYRLTARYRRQRHRRYVLTDKALIKRLDKCYSEHRAELCPTLLRLKDYSAIIGIDSRRAKRIARKQYKHDLAKGRKKARDKYRANLHSIAVLENDDRWFTQDNFGRVHTPITNMSASIRRCLHLEGERLFEIDIANSQPLLLGMLLVQWWNNGQNSLDINLVLNPETCPENSSENKDTPHSLHYDGQIFLESNILEGINLVNSLDLPDDVMGYFRLCEQGKLYEHIMEQANEQDREKVKISFFRLVFAAIRRRANYFQAMFPTVYDFACWVKKNDYRHLAHALQRFESNIMIRSVASILVENNIPCATIHDSVLVTRANVPFVQKLITKEFQKCLATPTLKTK